MIDEIQIDSDERGFVLVLAGDFTEEVQHYNDENCRTCGDPKARHLRRRGRENELRLVCRDLRRIRGAGPGLYREPESELRLRLPQDAAIALLAAARTEIGPWVAEMERERSLYDRATPEEREAVLRGLGPGPGRDHF